MPPSLQAKLLHVLQDKEFSRLGGDEDIEVDVRVITATNRNLEEYLHNSQFRQDLYYRINVVSIHMPALRERKDDIPELMDFFLQKYAASFNKRVPSVSKATLKSLISYTWPGNIRELENLAKKFVILENESLALTELVDPGVMAMPKPFAPGDPSNPRVSLKNVGRMAAREAERKLILGTLMETRWNRRKAAELLDISYKALLYKIKQNNIIRKISHLSSK
jgi:transcriptional regulator with PAS, ATPase and Fis domain